MSSPERAAMELLYTYPKELSFEELTLLFENLSQLRPKVVQPLLEHCGSIKAKRLFLHLADECKHPWVSAINLDKIDLGHGKRVLESGGRYHPKYKLSLPEVKGE